MESLIIGNFLAGFFGHLLEVVHNGANHWDTDLEALDSAASTFMKLSVELNVSWLMAEITESMEHSSWNFAGIDWSLNIVKALRILIFLHLLFYLRFSGQE